MRYASVCMLHVSFSIEGLLAAAVSAQGWAIPWRVRFAFFFGSRGLICYGCFLFLWLFLYILPRLPMPAFWQFTHVVEGQQWPGLVSVSVTLANLGCARQFVLAHVHARGKPSWTSHWSARRVPWVGDSAEATALVGLLRWCVFVFSWCFTWSVTFHVHVFRAISFTSSSA